MQSSQLDPLDAQDLALAVHARWVFDVPPTELEELVDAVLAWAEEPQLEEILDRAVERCWGSAFEDDLRESLNELSAQVPPCRHRVRSALLELDARHGASELARAFMLQCATQYAHDGLPFMFCLCCIEERLTVVDPAERRGVALEAARVAARDVEIDEEEIAVAVRACALNPGGVPEMLATDVRREALRQSAASPPADDPVWGAVCLDLARGYAAPERN